ncbi:adenylate/guanylate cyclase domain-containing protein [Pseudonocardia alaniniphila]|uniref:Adenylate/guanylate cyclase domain-containing protein n=1 Tax=Pseudonocardia alaniniphila TaxID=75291 RepID=A0ABS9TE34_9PSEU|nr:adenylate/guanylate cyclase domain-containing protein [Pseudonocardia alaniniphila]MCH6166805.1 adenylate/guanylate cyclase domain-containing protein [Pseudonocardia alaniniphila]
MARFVIDRSTRISLAVVVLIANLAGAAVVLVLAAWVLPEGPLADPTTVRLINLLTFCGYLVLAVPVGLIWGGLRFRMPRGGADTEQHLVLHGPLRLVTVSAVLWGVAAALFVVLNAGWSLRLAASVGETIVLGGITTCALSYLLSERILRPTAARVLAAHPPRRRVLPGVVVRALLFWALGTAVPVVGLLLSAVSALAYGDVSPGRLAVIVLTVGGTALVAGLLVTVGAARAVADPVNAVRRAMRRVQGGDLEANVTVYDGTELGQLQSGFNTMVAGLQERERIRDLFGRHVGRDVARAAAATGEVRLGGEVRRVAALFVDLVGSTTLAAQRPPGEVVGLLNRLFAVVVEVVEEHGGWVNKFEGDAALAVFGAPVDVPDPAGSALAAGRVLAARLTAELPEVTAGIGISAGDAVAGNVGDVRRYEYTVIGDPVNEAARLTELAKTAPGRVLAAGSAVDLADASEAARWTVGDTVVLRGRGAATRLASPNDNPEPAEPVAGTDGRRGTRQDLGAG